MWLTQMHITHKSSEHSFATIIGIATAALLCTSCGGSGSTAAESTGVRAGVVSPARAGMTVVEYDIDGREIQRSATTDSEGKFIFERPMTGARLEAISDAGSTRAARVLSARIDGERQTLKLTPLTTWFDQYLIAGNTRSGAAERVTALISEACGERTASSMPGELFADAAASAHETQWLRHAVDGYMAALRRVGLSPAAELASWKEALEQHVELLSRMCKVSLQVYGSDWLQSTTRHINERLKPATPIQASTVAADRSSVLQRVLSMMGHEAPMMAYSAEALALDVRPEVWRGNEVEMALELAVADASDQLNGELRPGEQIAAAAPVTNVEISRTTVFDRQGVMTPTLSGAINLAEPDASKVMRVSNTGAQDLTIDLIINGHRLKNLGDVVSEILAMPASSRSEPLHARAWRYFTTMTAHGWHISAGAFVHQPDLYLRSLGIGLCDDTSSALHWSWTALGYSARVNALNGHVITEVLLNDRWEMFDPDYRVYYFRRDGLVAGLIDLQQDPSLVTAPTLPVLPTSSPAYGAALADIYANTTGVHVPLPWYSLPIQQPLAGDFTIPAGGYLEVDPRVNYVMPSADPNGSITFAALRLWIPPGYTGALPLSGVLADVQGEGLVKIDNESLKVGANGIRGQIATRYASSTDVAIGALAVEQVGPAGLTVTILSNPKLFTTAGPRLSVEIRGASLTHMRISAPTEGTRL